jgi:polysaccharide export outer membrane protein
MCIAAASIAIACSDVGKYVWVENYATPAGSDAAYVIGSGDVLSVRVFNQDNMSARTRVRSDGKVSLPFLNDVDVAGHTPAAVAEQLQRRLKEFINNPVVTVSVEESKILQVSILGEVTKPGVYPLPTLGAGVLHALASAGGMTQYAHRDRIFVLRRASPLVRIRFSYEALSHGDGPAARFELREGDVVVVE